MNLFYGALILFFERLTELCDETNKKITPVLKELQISTGSISNWRNGSLPSAEALAKIADYFNVSIDYLIGRDLPELSKEDIDAGFSNHIKMLVTLDEHDLVIEYRELGKRKGDTFQLLAHEHIKNLTNIKLK